jgi:PhzF family phenazine biosynthesis protein
MRLPIYQIDAFASELFTGNPAAVVPLEFWPGDALLQGIAAENNLSETAYFRRVGEHYELRWFTPLAEVALCGHATLAAGYVILNHLRADLSRVHFETMSGRLDVYRDHDDLLAMDFPARTSDLIPHAEGLSEALGVEIDELYQTRDDYMAVLRHRDQVAELNPNLYSIKKLDCRALIVTAPGDAHCDFVSRFFGPAVGVDEDPVTGSAHCSLAPYWSERLRKKVLVGRQLSTRGGEVHCRVKGERVILSGRAVPYLSGFIEV